MYVVTTKSFRHIGRDNILEGAPICHTSGGKQNKHKRDVITYTLQMRYVP